MTGPQLNDGATVETGLDDVGEDLEAVYGDGGSASSLASFAARRLDFKPWHHPVKQIVRDRQWAALTRRLVRHDLLPSGARVLRYLTLPGPDLLDVHVLADVCQPLGVQIEYLGFDSSVRPSRGSATAGEQRDSEADDVPSVQHAGFGSSTAEAALRQAGRISDSTLVLPDRFEDIAEENSQASAVLRGREPFHVVNLDACDHLAYCPPRRERTTFDGLQALLKHQLRARTPWLLFVTTRVSPTLMGGPGEQFQHWISENLKRQNAAPFATELASALDASEAQLEGALAEAWRSHDTRFLRAYCIGFGKYLLAFFNGQANAPAKVELVSNYTYRVGVGQPDMLALAFRVAPEGMVALPPSLDGPPPPRPLEPAWAAQVARKAVRVWDLDQALEDTPSVRDAAVANMAALLEAARYDIAGWRRWLAEHPVRPMQVAEQFGA